MTGLNLEYADLRAADLREVNFSGSNLRYADLRGAQVQGANFQNACLYGARLQGIEAAHADFRNADLRQANWGGAYLDGALMPVPERLPSPGEIANDRDGGGQHGRGVEAAQKIPPKSVGHGEDVLKRRERDSNAGNDRNEQARGKARPGDRLENKEGRGR